MFLAVTFFGQLNALLFERLDSRLVNFNVILVQFQLSLCLAQAMVLGLEVGQNVVAVLVQRLETSHFILQRLDLHVSITLAGTIARMSRRRIMILLQVVDERLLLSDLLVSALDLVALLQILVLGVLRFLLVLLQLLLHILHKGRLSASTLEATRGSSSGR